MKGSRGKRSKAATRTDKVGTVGKPQVEEPKCCSPRLRSKSKVDYNENVLAEKGDVEKKLNQHGGKRKTMTKKVEWVESSKTYPDMKSSKAVKRLVLKRKTDVNHDAQSLVGSDHAEKQKQKQRRQKRSYPDELKREIAEKVAEKGNMSEVARIYSAKLGFPVNRSTIFGIKARYQVEQWDAAEKEREIQEDEEDLVADDDERSSEDDPFKDEAGEKWRSQDESDEEDATEGGGNFEAETEEEEGTNEDEGLLEDETDGEAGRSLVAKAMKGKEGEDEPEVEVTFDTTAFVETPLTEGCKKIRQLEMEMKKVEKNEELLKMKKAAYARELLREQEKQLMLLKKTLAVE